MAPLDEFRLLTGSLGDIAPFALLAHMKTIPGVIVIDKFAHHDNDINGVQKTELWTLSSNGPYRPASNLITTIIGADAGDNQPCEIEGLTQDSNGDWNIAIQNATLNGQTGVALTPPLVRGYRIFNRGSDDLAGDVYLYDGSSVSSGVPDDLTKVGAHILSGTPDHNQTLMSQFTIPSNYWGFLEVSNIYLANKTAASMTLAFQIRDFNGVFRTQRVLSLNSQGSGAIPFGAQGYIGPFFPKQDMRILIIDTSASGLAVGTDFQVYLMRLAG